MRPGIGFPDAPYNSWPNAHWPTYNIESQQAQGLVAWWSCFGANRGQVALRDALGRYHMTAFNTPTVSPSAFGPVVLFNDAATEYLAVAKAVVLAPPFSANVWFNSDDAASAQTLFSLGIASGGNNYYWVQAAGATGGDPVQVRSRGPLGNRTANSTTGYSINTWHLATGIFESTTSRSALIDGGSKSTTAGAGGGHVPDSTRIGNRTDNDTNLFSGMIAEVRVYNRALSDAEALAHWEPPTRWELHQMPQRRWVLVTAAGGTTFFSAVAGTLTSSGALIKKTETGRAGTLTSAGTVTKKTARGLVGTLASSGALAKSTSKSLAGTLTSAGALAKKTSKDLAGILTSSGTLIKKTALSLVGTLTSSSTLTKSIAKALAGTLTSTGELVKKTAISLSGALTSSSTVSGIKKVVMFLSGTLTSSSTLAKKTAKGLAGTLTSAGALVKKTVKSLAGTLTSSSTVSASKRMFLALAGTLTSSGTLIKKTAKGLTGTMTSSGTLAKKAAISLAGTLTSAGTLVKKTAISLVGTLTSSSTLAAIKSGAIVFLKTLTGTLTSSGTLAKKTEKSLSGTLTSSSSLSPVMTAIVRFILYIKQSRAWTGLVDQGRAIVGYIDRLISWDWER